MNEIDDNNPLEIPLKQDEVSVFPIVVQTFNVRMALQ